MTEQKSSPDYDALLIGILSDSTVIVKGARTEPLPFIITSINNRKRNLMIASRVLLFLILFILLILGLAIVKSSNSGHNRIVTDPEPFQGSHSIGLSVGVDTI